MGQSKNSLPGVCFQSDMPPSHVTLAHAERATGQGEQGRIVAKIEELFSRLDAGVAALKRVKTQLKRYRQAVLKQPFEGKLTEAWREAHRDELEPASVLLARMREEREKKAKAKRRRKKLPPLDTSQLPELPEGWVWTRVHDIGLLCSGQTPKGIGECDADGEVPYFRVADMNRPGNEMFLTECAIRVTQADLRRLNVHVRERGTVVFPKRGGAIATNKKRLLAQPSAYDLNTMGFCCLIPSRYFYYWILGVDLTKLSDGSNVPQIDHKDVAPLAFRLPSLAEQQRIVEEVERQFSIANEAEKATKRGLKQAERLRQSILKRAFGGRLVPQDPSDEPAGRLLVRIKAGRVDSRRP